MRSFPKPSFLSNQPSHQPRFDSGLVASITCRHANCVIPVIGFSSHALNASLRNRSMGRNCVFVVRTGHRKALHVMHERESILIHGVLRLLVVIETGSRRIERPRPASVYTQEAIVELCGNEILPGPLSEDLGGWRIH